MADEFEGPPVGVKVACINWTAPDYVPRATAYLVDEHGHAVGSTYYGTWPAAVAIANTWARVLRKKAEKVHLDGCRLVPGHPGNCCTCGSLGACKFWCPAREKEVRGG